MKKGRKINDDRAVGGRGWRWTGSRKSFRSSKPGAQVWLSDTEEKKGEEGEDCTFCRFLQTSEPVLLVTLKPAVNEAASLQRGEKKRRASAACLTAKQTSESASWSCGESVWK